MPEDHLPDVAARLYALPPEEFTAARDAAAKQASGKDARAVVKALKRPSPSAWVVNLLARAEPDLLDQLLALGPALAEAQRDGQGDALRRLGQQRRDLVGAVTAAAVGLAERAVSSAVRAEVEQTLEAALADPAAADAVRSGCLVRPLAYAGLGDVDVQGAVATGPPSRPKPRPVTRTSEPPALPAAEQRALEAAAALDDAVRGCEDLAATAERAAARARRAQDAARSAAEERERLERELGQARAAERDAITASDEAAEDGDAAAQQAAAALDAVAAAQRDAEQARAELDRLRRA